MLHNELHKLGTFASLCCGLLTLATLCVVFTMQTHATVEAGKTSSWPKCTGTINTTYRDRNNSELTYVAYEYIVDGKKYFGQRTYFDQLASSSYIPGNDSYRVGQTVPVFYNPQRPDEAVLRTGPEQHKNYFWSYGPGLLLGLALLFAGFKKLSRRYA